MKSIYAVAVLAIGTFGFTAGDILNRTKDRTTVNHNNSIESSPYVALVYHSHRFYSQNYCGATIISKYWLLSSKECFLQHGLKNDEDADLENFTIITGVNKFPGHSNRHNHHEIREVRSSKNTNVMSTSEIMVLVKLKKAMEFDATQEPIPIGGASDKPKNGDSVAIFGFLSNDWGHDYIDDLATTSISITDDCFENCPSIFSEDLEYRNIVSCTRAYDDQNGNIFEFFTGSPVIFHDKLVGFVPNTFYNVTQYVTSHYVLTINIVDKHNWIMDTINGKTPS